MQRYIYGVRSDIHIISLEETAAALRRAAKVVEEVAYLGGLILFVGNKKGQMEITARAAELAGACHLFTKWVPGTITNRDVLLGKEELRILNEMDEPAPGFEKHLLERRPVMPDLVVALNPMQNYVLLHECAQENIPTIGLIDTNADPTKVTYVIPGNDDRYVFSFFFLFLFLLSPAFPSLEFARTASLLVKQHALFYLTDNHSTITQSTIRFRHRRRSRSRR